MEVAAETIYRDTIVGPRGPTAVSDGDAIMPSYDSLRICERPTFTRRSHANTQKDQVSSLSGGRDA